MNRINNILYIGDLHIRIKNLSDIYPLKKTILQKAKKISLVIIGGDILNKKFTNQDCILQAEDLIRVCSSIAMTYVIVGNHDYGNDNQFLTDKHWMNHLKNLKNVVIVDNVTTIMFGFQMTCVPYVPNGRLVEALNLSGTPWKDSRLVFAHQEIKGCLKGKNKSSDGDFWDPSYPTLISGHVHQAQTVNYNVVYPGSTLNQGDQNGQQRLVFIKTTFTEDNIFKYDMSSCFLPTLIKQVIIVKTFNELRAINNSTQYLKNTILKIQTTDEKYEIKNSLAYKQLLRRTYYVSFS